MPEEQYNLFDMKLVYELCENIIKSRKFECLIQLNEQCSYFYAGKMAFFNEHPISLTIEEDAFLIMLYYIYYILLDEKERNLFLYMQKTVLSKNVSLCEEYLKTGHAEQAFSLEEVDIETSNCFKYAKYILEKYSKVQCEEEKINLDYINEFVYLLYKNEWNRIPNDFYLIYMLALGTLPYKKILSNLSYEIILNLFNNACLTILDRFNNGLLTDFVENDCEEAEENYIEDDFDRIRF